MSVARLRRELTTAEFTAWAAFYTIEAEETERQQRQAKRGQR